MINSTSRRQNFKNHRYMRNIIIFKFVLIVSSTISSSALFGQISSSPDNSVNAIIGAPSGIPSGIDNNGGWSSTNAYWASPSIYRSSRTPNDGSGNFPFNQYGELMIQGTSHGNSYNKGISFLTWNGTSDLASIKLRIKENGYVGVGTTNPMAKLEILQDTEASDNALVISELGNSQKIYLHLAKNGTTEYGYFNLGGGTQIRGNGQLSTFDGRMAIATTSTGSHKLAVGGSIGAREIKVEATGWSDFVFENDYNLRTLEEVEQHINENGHLPEIPSETEVTENGINLGEMDAKLLQKIEELTLYLIEQNKQNKEQQERIEKLEKMNFELLKKLENK